MKKDIFISIVALAAILITFSCKKTEEPISNQYNGVSKSNIEQKITNFLNPQFDPYKTEKTYSIDSAIWYTCAGLNYTYGIYDSSFVYIERHISYFTVDLDGSNRVTESDLADLYADMVDSLDVFFNELQDNIKHVFYCEVFEVDVSGGELELGMNANIGCGYSGSYYGTFGATDWWHSVMLEGKCNGYTDEGDAAEAIEYKIMHPQVVSDPSRRKYAIPLDSTETDGTYYEYGSSPCGYRAYFLYEEEEYNGSACLSPDHLNFYLTSNGLDYIINDNKPNEMDFIEIKMVGDLILISEESYEEIHAIKLIYGTIEETTVPASSL